MKWEGGKIYGLLNGKLNFRRNTTKSAKQSHMDKNSINCPTSKNAKKYGSFKIKRIMTNQNKLRIMI